MSSAIPKNKMMLNVFTEKTNAPFMQVAQSFRLPKSVTKESQKDRYGESPRAETSEKTVTLISKKSKKRLTFNQENEEGLLPENEEEMSINDL